MLAAEQHVVTPALERVIEANTYLSGVGFESGGLAAAHAIHNGSIRNPGCASLLPRRESGVWYAERSWCWKTQPVDEIGNRCRAVSFRWPADYPAQLDIKQDIPAKMRIVARQPAAEGETIHNMPGGATPDAVYAALLVADQYGQRYLQEWE